MLALPNLSYEAAPRTNRRVHSLVDLLELRATEDRRNTGYSFLVDGETELISLSYRELDEQARAIAACMAEDAQPGDRALLLFGPGLDFLPAFFACLYAGIIAVPAYPPHRNRNLLRLLAIARDAQPKLILTTSALLPKMAKTMAESAEFAGIQLLAIDLVAEQSAQYRRRPVVDRDTLAFLQYTSGSTGTPKGVMLTHENLLHNAAAVYQAVEQSPLDSYVSWLPVFHDMGFMAGVLQPLYAGSPCIQMSPAAFLQRPARWLNAISRYKATVSGAPNFGYELCVNKISNAERDQLDLSSWTVAFNGAEPVRAETLGRFIAAFAPCGLTDRVFYPCYGLAEATLMVSGGYRATKTVVRNFDKASLANHSVNFSSDGSSLVSCGRSLPEQEIVIVDPVQLRPTAEIGEIWVKGASVAKGYWNRPEETRDTFKAFLHGSGDGPYLRTGDLGFIDREELFVTGRLKDLLIIRGQNHYPQDIEHTVQQCDSRCHSGCGAAFSVLCSGDERLVVVQEVASRRENNFDQIIQLIRQSIAEVHELAPYVIVLVHTGTIHKTSSGKIQRNTCKTAFLNNDLKIIKKWQEEASTGVSSPQMVEENATAWLIAEVAGKAGTDPASIDVHQPLTAYGLDSLTAVELAHKLQAEFGIAVKMADLFEGLTIADILYRVEPEPEVPAANEQERYPLSQGQQALWFIYQMAPASAAYHISRAVRITSALNVTALRDSFQTLVDRHPCLRTTFSSAESELLQQVDQESKVYFQHTDASGWPEMSLREALTQESHKPFDLVHGPVLRVHLFTRAEREHVVHVAVHHIVADFWSFILLFEEIGKLYEVYSKKAGSQLPSPTRTYADWIAWHNQRLAGAEGERLWSYWKKELSGDIAPLSLPADHPRPRVQTFHGSSVSFNINEKLTRQLKELGARYQATLFTALLAGFQVLLHRLTRQTTIIVGTPSTGRSRVEFANTIGYFVNPLPVRGDFSTRQAFSGFLLQIRNTLTGALAHELYPFPLMADKLGIARDFSSTPVFQTMLVLHKTYANQSADLVSLALAEPDVQAKLGGLSIQSVPLEERVAQFDLMLTLGESEQGLAGRWQYNSDLFDAATVDIWARCFGLLLEAVVANSEMPIQELPFIPEKERRELLIDCNRTELEYDREQCLHERIAWQAALAPDKAAIVWNQSEVCYRNLDAQANQIASYLRRFGLLPGHVAAIYMRRSPRMIAAMLGVWKTGAAYMPIDPSSPERRLQLMLAEAGAKVVITQKELCAKVAASGAITVLIDQEWDRITEAGSGSTDVAVDSQQIAYLIYTSGSTGLPKGIILSHRNAMSFVTWAEKTFSAEEFSGILASTSISFDVSVFELWATLCCGGTIFLADDVLQWWENRLDATYANRVKVLITVPSAIAGLLPLDRLPESVCTVNFAGERLKESLVSEVYRRGNVKRVNNLYGPTETTTYSSWTTVPERQEVTIGRGVGNTQLYVLDPALQLVLPGVLGELYISGAGLAYGYWKHPDWTAERFLPNPFSVSPGERMYRTGDIARWRHDRELEYIGRADHQVKVRGYRIELGEIENVLERHPQIGQAVVVLREQGTGEKQLVGYVVGAAGAKNLQKTDLREYLRAHLPEYMVPNALVLMEQFPLTPNGKVDRKVLPEPESTEQPGEEHETYTAEEEILCGIFAAVLKREQVGAGEHFFEAGGHSLLATQVMARVRSALNVDLPLRALFEEPTARGLAKRLRPAQVGAPESESALVDMGREEDLPLSYAQQRMWFLQQMQPASVAYNMAMALRLMGGLNEEALALALNAMVKRHEVLRTCVAVRNGNPVQEISEELNLVVEKVNLRAIKNEEDRAAEAQRLAREEATRPFDLGRAPLLRARLLQTAEQEHVLTITMHHIVSDGWSKEIMIREFTAMYGEYAGTDEAKPVEFPKLRVQYGDYAVWQRKWLQGAVLERQLEYWRNQLAGLEPLELPSDHVRPAVMSERGASLAYELPAERTEKLAAVSRAEGVTLFMTLMAVFQVLLGRCTGMKDIAVGTPVANRKQEEVEGLIGFFVNALVLRTNLQGDPSFREVLHQVRRTALDAYAHQDLPFEKLVEELKPERDLSRTPLFQVVLALENTAEEELKLPGLKVKTFDPGIHIAKFDLVLTLREGTQGLTGELIYASDLYDPATILRFSRQLNRLFESLVQEIERPVWQLSLLDEAEWEQIVTVWNQTVAEYPRERCIHELIEQQAQRTPEAVAVIYEDQRLRYVELNARANQLAHYLRKLGVGPEVLVGICMERSLELVVGLVGIVKAGGAYVPLDPSYPSERLTYMLADARVPVVLTQEKFKSLVQTSTRVVSLDSWWKVIDGESRQNPEKITGPDNLVYVIYTSGSTGKPKGVMNVHSGICNRLWWMQEQYRLDEGDRVLQKTPFSFDVSVWEFFWPLMTGAQLVVARPGGHQDCDYLIETIERFQITTIHFVPAMLSVWLEHETVGKCSSLRRVICSGEALGIEEQKKFHSTLDAELHNLYGPTEASIDVTCWQCLREWSKGFIPIGKPIANTQTYVLDEYMQPAPVGIRGELHLGGVGLARGYCNRPELTAERFVPNPFGETGARLYCTGDGARHLPDGNIEFLGRLDHQVKIRGNRIELGEIEGVLQQHPAVKQAVIALREDKSGDRRLMSYVVPSPDTAAPIRQLLQMQQQKILEGCSQYELPNGHLVLHKNRGETEFLYREIFGEGGYLKHQVQLHPGACVLDVGANIGLFSLFVHWWTGGAKIYAFEPVPSVFHVLQANVKLHGLDAQLFSCGLGSLEAEMDLEYFPYATVLSGSGDESQAYETVKSFLSSQDYANLSQTEIEAVLNERLQHETVHCRVRPLSRVIAEEGICRIDLLKVDVEGAEWEVLQGLGSDDWQKVHQVVIEVHDVDGRLEQIRALLKQHGFIVAVEQSGELRDTVLYNVYATRKAAAAEKIANVPSEAGYWSSPRRLTADLRAHLQQQLPDYMVPSAFVLLEKFPVNANGKIDRKALPVPETESVPGISAPLTSTEELIAGIWSSLLGSADVQKNSNFFELGGHSLLVARLASRLRQIFGCEIAVRTIFEFPVLSDLSAHIETLVRQKQPLRQMQILRVPRDGEMPLSSAQERLWFLDRFTSSSSAYNIAGAARLIGDLNKEALRKSLAEIVCRHEALRTSFQEVNSKPVQRIHDDVPLAFSEKDLPESSAGTMEERLKQQLRQEGQHGFVLSGPGLLQCTLFCLGLRNHVLLLVMHHIIADGWSIGVLIRELKELYEAHRQGRPSLLPPLEVQYVDYAACEREMLNSGAITEDLDYWKRQLSGAPSLELPTDLPRGDQPSYEGGIVGLDIGRQLTVRLKQLAQQEGVTLYMVLLAVFYLLLSRYTGQLDIVVGTDVANRSLSGVEGLIGLFVNQLVLRTDLSGNPTFRQLVSRVREVTLSAYAHEHAPFGKLVEMLQPKRNLGRNPLFQVMVIFQNAPMPSLEFSGLKLEPLDVDIASSVFDLSLAFVEKDREVRASLRHSYLFKTETAQRMLKDLVAVLERVTQNPDVQVNSLEVRKMEETRTSSRDERFSRLTKLKPKPVAISPANLVSSDCLFPGKSFPVLFRSEVPDVNLASWVAGNRQQVLEKLTNAGALLFRGFGLESLSQFRAFTQSVCPELIEYGERSSPRTKIDAGVYTSTDHPADQSILLHNEQSYTLNWPMKIWFCCLQPSLTGGCTPLADSRNILKRLKPETVAKFSQKQVTYMRNYGDGMGLNWPEVFQTNDKSLVEQHCRDASIEFEWKGNNRLRTRQVRPAIRTHPQTGERSWFNHMLFFHITSLPPAVHDALTSGMEEEDFPFNTYYGDGTPIEPSVLEEVRQAYALETLTFPWQKGDVLMVDNMLVAHGREPFTGPRKVVVAMAEPFNGQAAAGTDK